MGFEANGKTDVCKMQNEEYYVDGSFVTGCWNSLYLDGYSADLTCSGDASFTLTTYNNSDCNDEYKMPAQTINAGCDWFNGTKVVPIFPNYFNLTYSTNHTYFKINECGGGNNWLWLWIAGPTAFVLICCGCLAFFCWFARCRKKKNGAINATYVK